MTVSRRTILKSSPAVGLLAVGGVTGQLATCSSSGGIVVNPAVIDAIQGAVAAACQFVPTAETIVALVGASFPVAAGVATIADTVLSQISAVLCQSYQTAGKEKLLASPMVGTIPVHGFHVGPDGKLVAF